MSNTPLEPSISVIIPTFQRPMAVDGCLRALAAQDLARNQFEVIVVDDGSAEPPRDAVKRWAESINVRLLEQRNSGPAKARNAGASAARGGLLVFTDDDCRPDARWLSEMASASTRHSGSAIGGRIINALGDGLCSTASQMLIDHLYGYYNASADVARFFVTSNLAFPADRFHAMGGFDVTFPLAAGEDRDMCDRWREAGYALTYHAEAIVYHAHALSLPSFCRQHFNYGRGAHHLHRARARRGLQELRVEPMRFYTRLLLHPMRQGVGARGPILSLLMLLSQAAYASGYYLERARSHV